jgi:CBS domain-containing protein
LNSGDQGRNLTVCGLKEASMLIAHVLRDKGATVFTLSGEASLEEACAELHTRKVGALVVLDGEGRVFGVLSERDLVREVARRGAKALSAKVASAMTRDVITADPRETIDECLARMTDRRIRHLPVLDGGRLAGVVSIGDLVKHRIASVEAEAAAMQAYISTH